MKKEDFEKIYYKWIEDFEKWLAKWNQNNKTNINVGSYLPIRCIYNNQPAVIIRLNFQQQEDE